MSPPSVITWRSTRSISTQARPRNSSVVLTPDTLRQTETVEAKADPFETARGDSPDAITLAGNDAKNLGSVLADDPLRAVQSLPGVTSNNDFEARFSLRGADFSRIGLYLDGILLHEPFHMLQGEGTTGSASAFNGDMVEEMEMHEGAFPVRFEDRDAGVLDVETRDGSRDSTIFRAAASASNAGFMAEGPLGRRANGKAKGSWLVAVRKSYLQYILARTFPDASLVFGLEDVQARLSYDLSAEQYLDVLGARKLLESRPVQRQGKAGNQFGDGSGLPLHAQQSGVALHAHQQAADRESRGVDAREIQRFQPHSAAARRRLLRRVGVELHGYLDVERAGAARSRLLCAAHARSGFFEHL